MKNYILISVCEREIKTKQFYTLEEAQTKMLKEIEENGGVENPKIGQCSRFVTISEMSAFSNIYPEFKQDWLIVKLEK